MAGTDAPTFSFTSGASAGSGTLRNPDSLPVYLGGPNGTNAAPLQAGQDANDRKPASNSVDVITAKSKFNDSSYMSDTTKAALGQAMYAAGLISHPADMHAVYLQWQDAVEEAALRKYYGQNITPFQVIAMRLSLAAGMNNNREQTATRTSYNIPSPQDGEAMVTDLFHSALGRDPSKDELAKYTSMLVGIAKANPSVENTTSDKTGAHTTSTSTTHSLSQAGMEQALLDKVKADPEYGAYQAATTYYNAALKAIGSPV